MALSKTRFVAVFNYLFKNKFKYKIENIVLRVVCKISFNIKSISYNNEKHSTASNYYLQLTLISAYIVDDKNISFKIFIIIYSS